MKKLGLVVAVLMVVAAPALATVNITCTADGNIVTVNYAVSGEPNKVRAFGLDITVDSPAAINEITYTDPNYWVYPGSIVIVNGEVNDVGSPDANSIKFPMGTLPGLDSNGVTIEMGSLYYPTRDNSPNAPNLSGKLLKFKVCHVFNGCKVKITENVIRGGVVLTNPTIDPTVTVLSPAYTFNLECFPSTYTTYNDWKTLGRPNCWCAKPIGSGYQCDGDADGAEEGTIIKYRVYTKDLGAVIASWKKATTDPAFNPCADLDHKAEGTIIKYRVYSKDLGIVIAKWKKTSAQLPGNCPRPE